MQRLYEELVVSSIAQRPARAVNAATECCLRNNATIPDFIYELILAHNPISVAHQVNDQVEHLRFDVHGLTRAPNLLPAGVNLKLREAVSHRHLDCASW
ncbi:hypothetical protein XH98_06450 [Bradyrhizobium sp. CCBAU 51745]|nr:hypothetical protein [Bradyrhizobium sp. CCBAU 45384]MDA9438768.1 hypothetical protein [Bradyrhizobium sp. CCBAU 51745]